MSLNRFDPHYNDSSHSDALLDDHEEKSLQRLKEAIAPHKCVWSEPDKWGIVECETCYARQYKSK